MTSKIRIEIRINLSKPDDVQLQQTTDQLRRARQLSETVRQGIALIVDLRAGKTDVLFALFPHLQARIVPDNVLDNARTEPYGTEFLKKLVAVVDEFSVASYYRRAA